MNRSSDLCALVALAVGVLLVGPPVQAQTLFVGENGTNAIDQVSAGGTVTPFGFGNAPVFGLAVDNNGNLFVAMTGGGSSINEITPGGVETTFVSGLNGEFGLAFSSNGNL